MRVLITGGGGFLGQHVARRMSAAGWAVRVMDTQPIAKCDADIEQIQGDITDTDAVMAAVEGVDAIVQAAYAPPRLGEPALTAVNVEGNRNVLEAAVRGGTGRVVLISSTVVDRRLRRHPIARSPQAKLGRYARTKIEAEQIVDGYGAGRPSTAIVRPKTFVGPGSAAAFALVFESLRTGRPVPILGNGCARYQLVHVEDLADGVAKLCACDARGVFSFGASSFGAIREDLEALVRHAGTGSQLRFVPPVLARTAIRALELVGPPVSEWHYASAYGTDSIVDIGRARSELGWEPRWSNQEALIHAYDWYVRHGLAAERPTLPLVHKLGAIVARAARGRRLRA